VDFARQMVIGVFLGSRPTGGFDIEITSIEQEGADLVVTWRDSRPDQEGALRRAAVSAPGS
jgi:hypothetical protein